MKYDVKFSCGHTHTVELFGKAEDREKKIAFYEEYYVCPECYKKQKEEENKIGCMEVEMSYREYKENYSECKTKADSYDKKEKTIIVYVPEETEEIGKVVGKKEESEEKDMTAKEIYDKAAQIAADKIVEEDKKTEKGFFEAGIPTASPKQEKEALAELGYTPDDLLAMEHDKVLGEVLRQLNIGAGEWAPIDYEKLEGEVME